MSGVTFESHDVREQHEMSAIDSDAVGRHDVFDFVGYHASSSFNAQDILIKGRQGEGQGGEGGIRGEEQGQGVRGRR